MNESDGEEPKGDMGLRARGLWDRGGGWWVVTEADRGGGGQSNAIFGQ